MKKLLRFLTFSLLSGVFFIACNNDSTPPILPIIPPVNTTPESTPAETTPTGTPEETTPANSGISSAVQFDFTNAKALAKLEANQNGARAAENSNELGNFIKILADGTMANAVTVKDGYTLSEISAVYKSPNSNSKDLFLVFSNTSYLGWDANHKQITIGKLICVHEDGSIADILKTETSYMNLKDSSITFDSIGNLYFVSNTYETGDVIYQFNPNTNLITQLVAGVQGTSYNKIQVDNNGQWIFVSGSRNGYFLRAIPISNPNSPINVYFSSSNSVSEKFWTYDTNSSKLYFMVQDGNNDGLFIATKAGGFIDKTFIKNKTSTGLENFVPEELFDAFNSSYTTYTWNSSVKTNGEFDASKAVTALLALKNLSSSEVDIRFDKYLTQTGALKALAILTAGKKNEEAFQALDNTIGKAALDLVNTTITNNYFSYSNENNGYQHNFLADILYVKNTDTLLETSNSSIFQKTNGYYSTKNTPSFVVGNNGHSKSFCVGLKKTETYFLNYLYSFCNVEGQKEFRLTAFQNDAKYSALYSTLKNEEALQWITADTERVTLFNEAMGDVVYIKKQYDWYKNQSTDQDWIAYCTNSEKNKLTQFLAFIGKTCYIANTNTKAMTWNREENFSISYSSMYNFNNGKLLSSNNGVYYEYTNLNNTNSMTTTESPYYYLVQIADSTGKQTEEITKIQLPAGKVVQSLNTKEKIFMKYSLISNGSELGYHHIYSVDLSSGAVKNHFDNVPNRNSLEVISYSTAGDKLYYSAVRGTSVENGIVNIETNEYNPLETQRKMVAVYAL